MTRLRSMTAVKHPGIAAATFMLGLNYYWFGLANRHEVFLYQHIDRPGDPPAMAFDPVTTSRYWMAPLLAAGIALAFLLPGLVWRGETPTEDWRKEWLAGSLLLLLSLPPITMGFNDPTMPAPVAVQITLSGMLGLGLALATMKAFARNRAQATWLAFESLGLLAPLLMVRAAELPSRGIMAPGPAWTIAISSLPASLAWLQLSGRLRQGRGLPHPGVAVHIVAAYTWALLAFPVAHHLLATPPSFRYITSASNIFGHSWSIVAISLLAVALIAAAHQTFSTT